MPTRLDACTHPKHHLPLTRTFSNTHTNRHAKRHLNSHADSHPHRNGLLLFLLFGNIEAPTTTEESDTLLKSGTEALCYPTATAAKHEGALWTGMSTGLEDCAAKCHANAECNFYSWWGSSNWCEINEVCDHWGSDGSHVIYSYSIAGYGNYFTHSLACFALHSHALNH